MVLNICSKAVTPDISEAIGLSLTPSIEIDTLAEKLDEIPSLVLNVKESTVALSDVLE